MPPAWLLSDEDWGLRLPVESRSACSSQSVRSYSMLLVWRWEEGEEEARGSPPSMPPTTLACCRNFSVWSVLRVRRSWTMVSSWEKMAECWGCWGTRMFCSTSFSLLCIRPTSSGFLSPGRSEI